MINIWLLAITLSVCAFYAIDRFSYHRMKKRCETLDNEVYTKTALATTYRKEITALKKENTNLLAAKEFYSVKIVDNQFSIGDKVKVQYNGKEVIGDIVRVKYNVGGAGKKLYHADEIERVD